MVKKLIIILIIIIAAIIFIGYYPPFFPFLKYGLFSKPITREVFSIDNFPYHPNDPQFLIEITKIVKEKWYDDARLAIGSANFLANEDIFYYNLTFFSDLHPLQIKSEKGVEKISDRLEVYYNTESHIAKEKFSFGLSFQFHEYTPVHNRKLIGTACIDKFICQWSAYSITGNIDPAAVTISAKRAYEIALTINPDVSGRMLLLRKSYQDKATGETREANFPYWITGGLFGKKINAITGEISEEF